MRRTILVELELGLGLWVGLLAAMAAGGCGRGAATMPDEPRDDRAGLVINEVSAAGRTDDWFEVVNAGSHAVDLSDFVFVDGAGDLERARAFPGFVLAPGERYVADVAASGFQLASDEALYLYRADDGGLVDVVDWTDGASPSGGSYARQPDATGGFATAHVDTRGEPNTRL